MSTASVPAPDARVLQCADSLHVRLPRPDRALLAHVCEELLGGLAGG